jgi:hypothetical protein
MNVLLDGPVDFDLAGDRVTVRGTSDGRPYCFTLRLEDALLSSFRFNQAADAHMARRAESKIIPLPRHADTA